MFWSQKCLPPRLHLILNFAVLFGKPYYIYIVPLLSVSVNTLNARERSLPAAAGGRWSLYASLCSACYFCLRQKWYWVCGATVLYSPITAAKQSHSAKAKYHCRRQFNSPQGEYNWKSTCECKCFFWWGKMDSNHRSHWQQIYSLPPLAAREFPHIQLRK